ncbi:hypothetical protein FRB94_007147 [Tulasnella sp. JGI-2019a]|nr:hypothetical protein FRB93_012466 [Tulasnella sp. JGI-2019a]KAG9011954.1 hypothetical protein FRB94_007147 [Tulasnella sp. JGI-2019a]KAG9036274.1 hypothetical protein FRB95_009422 [Tulasnella sp. JGI-2019a]
MGSRQARNIVRSILGTSETPLSTKQVYELAWKRFPQAAVSQSESKYPSPPLSAKEHYERKQPPLPPRGVSHPIPSMKHLKTRVLPLLVARSEVEKVYTTRAQAVEEPKDAIKSKGRASTAASTSSPAIAAKAWLWRIHPTSKEKEIPKTPNDAEWKWEAPVKAVPKTHAEMYPLPENIHLNPRRRRARIAKVAREKVWVAEVAKAVEAGRRAAEKRAAKAAT